MIKSKKQDLKGTWRQAFLGFLWPIGVMLIFRWVLIEPFVIPSRSMVPTLLVNDHILVKKYSYGIKIPFFDAWIVNWALPKRGQIVVFKYPLDPKIHYIKRLVGLPGDLIQIKDGHLHINGVAWAQKISGNDDEDNMLMIENRSASGEKDNLSSTLPGTHIIRKSKFEGLYDNSEFQVPESSYFFMGDNRDESNDSRSWGFVDRKYLLGEAFVIWLSCEKVLEANPFLCDPQFIRFDRLFKKISGG